MSITPAWRCSAAGARGPGRGVEGPVRARVDLPCGAVGSGRPSVPTVRSSRSARGARRLALRRGRPGAGGAEHADPSRLGAALTPQRALELFDTQLTSRHLDLAARELRGRGQGFYTIGSSGHEGNAAVAAALRPDDPALLHYRSGAFYVERARQVPGTDAVRDVLLGLVAATAEPISGGRHKVFGRKELAVLPQTSTIASHLPRASGVAFATSRAAKLGLPASGRPTR
jgi:hypothetical protein